MRRRGGDSSPSDICRCIGHGMQKFPRNQTELVHVKRQRTMGPKYCYAGSSELVYNVGTMVEPVKGYYDHGFAVFRSGTCLRGIGSERFPMVEALRPTRKTTVPFSFAVIDALHRKVIPTLHCQRLSRLGALICPYVHDPCCIWSAKSHWRRKWTEDKGSGAA